ncbi:hypothetical protein KDA_53870 [Dictyobacter alpinus]|uniref:Uncharacterized protein n=1 Tax=Dictyobacter alpinus TaxID=2014873 RepID=A0A402BEU6_9CHLR|nr:hypothetical protein KDA_53870 [Dictyobacter alpinus]
MLALHILPSNPDRVTMVETLLGYLIGTIRYPGGLMKKAAGGEEEVSERNGNEYDKKNKAKTCAQWIATASFSRRRRYP